MAASQQLFYYIRPPLDRMLGEGILMLVRRMKLSLDGCWAACILLNSAPIGPGTYDKVQKSVSEGVKQALN